MKKVSFKTLLLLCLILLVSVIIFLSSSPEDTISDANHTNVSLSNENTIPDLNHTKVPVTTEENVWDLNHTEALLANIMQASTDDLDGMLKSRVIRVLVIPSEIMLRS